MLYFKLTHTLKIIKLTVNEFSDFQDDKVNAYQGEQE
jgi:hypothetical protein